MRIEIKNVCHAGILFAREMNKASGDANAVVSVRCREETSVRFHRIILRKLCTAPKFRTCEKSECVDISRRIMLIIKHYMYTGAPKPVQYKDVIPLYIASNILGIRKLSQCLETYLAQKKYWKMCSKKCDMSNIKDNEMPYLEQFIKGAVLKLPRKRRRLVQKQPQNPRPTGALADPEIAASSTASVNSATNAFARSVAPGTTDSSQTPAVHAKTFVREPSKVHRFSAPFLVSCASPDLVSDLQQCPFPLIFFTKDSEGVLHFNALTAAHEVIPSLSAFQPDSAISPLIFDHCVIARGVLFTIDSKSRKILALNLNRSTSEALEIPNLKDPHGLTLSFGCPYLWSGSMMYEIYESNGSLQLNSWGSTGFEDMRNIRVLRRGKDRLTVAMNVGHAGMAKVTTLSNGSKPKLSDLKDDTMWFVGSTKDDLFYIRDGRVQSASNEAIVHDIFERYYFKDTFNVGNILFLRTRVGEVRSRVTVVDMLTAKTIHSFTVEGEMRLVQTISC